MKPRCVGRARAALAGFALATAIASHASAQANNAAEQAARDHFDRGVALGNRGEWPQAVLELEAALAFRPTAPVYFNLGVAYRAVHRYADAVAQFERFLELRGAALDPAQAEQIHRLIDSMRHSLGTVIVHTTPRDATCLLDGTPLASSDARREVDPGEHTVSALAPGYRTAQRTVNVPSGEQITVALALVPTQVEAELHVESNVPAAAIRIDGDVSRTGVADEFVAPGTHRIDVSAAGYQPFHRDVVLTARGSLRVRADLVSARTLVASPWLWGIAGGVTAVAIVVAVVVAVVPHNAVFQGPLPNIEVGASGP